ncbi:hypothetical protein ACWG8W_06025 [Citricoccus zhacaiensis]
MAKRPVRMSDGSYKMEDREIYREARDIRWTIMLAEFGPATRKQIAYMSGATEVTVNRVMDVIRKRLDRFVEAGALIKEGDGKGMATKYRLTEVGRYDYPGNLPEDFLPPLTETMQLNIMSVVVRLADPRPDSFFFPVPAGETAVGLPVIANSRMAFDMEQMKLAFDGSWNRERQISDLETWLNSNAPSRAPSIENEDAYAKWLDEPSYPVVPYGWSLRDLSADDSNKISAYFRKRFRSESGVSKWALPCYMLAPLDASGKSALAAVDFVIPLPHVENEAGERELNLMACIVDIEHREEEEVQARLAVIASAATPYSRIVVFIPNDKPGIATQYEIQWAKLIEEGLVPDHFTEDHLWLHSYGPITGRGRRFTPASPDKRGSNSETYARG